MCTVWRVDGLMGGPLITFRLFRIEKQPQFHEDVKYGERKILMTASIMESVNECSGDQENIGTSTDCRSRRKGKRQSILDSSLLIHFAKTYLA